MTREQKIAKLANAIIAYRGRRNGIDGPWKQQPQPGKREDILRWLEKLGATFDTDQIEKIDNFKSFNEMRTWINGVRAHLVGKSGGSK